MRISRQKILVGTRGYIHSSFTLFFPSLRFPSDERTFWVQQLGSPVALLFHVVNRAELFQVSKSPRRKTKRGWGGQCRVTEWADEHKAKTTMMCQIQDNPMDTEIMVYACME
jgi:hypothetical protein